MKTFKAFLTETLDAPYPYQKISDIQYKFKTLSGGIGTVHFSTPSDGKWFNVKSNYAKEILFSQSIDGKELDMMPIKRKGHEPVGKEKVEDQNPMQFISTVVKIVDDFQGSHHAIDLYYFSSSMHEGKTRLYTRLAKMFQKKLTENRSDNPYNFYCVVSGSGEFLVGDELQVAGEVAHVLSWHCGVNEHSREIQDAFHEQFSQWWSPPEYGYVVKDPKETFDLFCEETGFNLQEMIDSEE